jgi:hypothetical protein
LITAALIGVTIERRTLKRPTTAGGDDLFHPLWSHFLSVRRTSSAWNAFIHQGTTEVVDPSWQAMANAVRAKLHPGRLDVADQWVEYETRYCMD